MELSRDQHEIIEATQPEELAARYSLFVPFATASVCFVLLKVGDLVFHEPEAFVDRHTLAVWLLLFMASSLVAGLGSLCGMSHSTWKRVVWKAGVGIIASLLLGFYAFIYLMLEHFRPF